MILDSGSTDIIVPLNDLKAILAMLPTLSPASGCIVDETTTSPAYTGSNRIRCTCIAGGSGTFPAPGNTAANVAAYFNGNVGGVRRFPDLTVKLGSV